MKKLSLLPTIKSELKKYNARLLSLCLSGSHLYGFPSEDSDFDYRGVFLAESDSFLGLYKPQDVIELKPTPKEDIVLFELKKEIKLVLASNCNVLEHITAKQIFASKEYFQLKNLIPKTINKTGLYNSYRGMATFNYKKFIKKGKGTVKKYLYVFRGLMAGTYALETGKIEPNIGKLNLYFKIPEVEQLVELKRAGKEEENLPAKFNTKTLDKKIDKLFKLIDNAYKKSKLPEKTNPKAIEKLNKFLISTRKKYL